MGRHRYHVHEITPILGARHLINTWRSHPQLVALNSIGPEVIRCAECGEYQNAVLFAKAEVGRQVGIKGIHDFNEHLIVHLAHPIAHVDTVNAGVGHAIRRGNRSVLPQTGSRRISWIQNERGAWTNRHIWAQIHACQCTQGHIDNVRRAASVNRSRSHRVRSSCTDRILSIIRTTLPLECRWQSSPSIVDRIKGHVLPNTQGHRRP